MSYTNENITRAMTLTWARVKRAQARLWADWMVIGEGLMEGRLWAMQQAGTNKPEGKGYNLAFSEWLKTNNVHDMDPSERAKLLQLMEERLAVEEWRANVSTYERRNCNSPVVVWRKWTASTRVKKPKSRAGNVSGREYERAVARISELEEEAESYRARIAELEEEIEAARSESARR